MNKNHYLFEMSEIANYLQALGRSFERKEDIITKFKRASLLLNEGKPGLQYKAISDSIDLQIEYVKSIDNLMEVIQIAKRVGRQVRYYHAAL